MSIEAKLASLVSPPTTNTSPLGRTVQAHSCLFEVRSQTFTQLLLLGWYKWMAMLQTPPTASKHPSSGRAVDFAAGVSGSFFQGDDGAMSW